MDLVGLQIDTVWHDKAATHRRVEALLEANPVAPGSLLALPEMFSTGFSMEVDRIAEGEERVSERFLSDLALRTRCTVVGGVVRTAPGGRGRNEALIFGPDGESRLRYQKIHPFTYGGETDYYEPGASIGTFEWQGFRVAPFICYDLRFPEIFRAAVRQGAQLFVVIANWPRAREEHWLTLLRARAIENQAYLIGVNRCGVDPKVPYSGRSQIIGPRGEILANAGEQEALISAPADLDALLEYRRQFPALQDMRFGSE